MPSEPAAAPVYASAQRQNHLLLLMSLPQPALTLRTACDMYAVDAPRARQDIAEVEREIQRAHRLRVSCEADGIYRVQGSELDRRLCLLHGVRRALRHSPAFIDGHFTPALRASLRQRQTARGLSDTVNLQALIDYCGRRLTRPFCPRDGQLLQLMFLYELCQLPAPRFSPQQQQWLRNRRERQVAESVVQLWRRHHPPLHDSEADLLTLLFSQLHIPQRAEAQHPSEQQLLRQIALLIHRFETLAGRHFQDRDALGAQLYSHLSQALERCCFAIGIDTALTGDVQRLYPRLMRTACAALRGVETFYGIRLSHAERSLVAVIFGAWLMQENALQEKQVLLLTGEDNDLEQQIERQIRELTLMPISVKYLDAQAFQRDGAPRGTALVISPYATPLPLYSPPVIHTGLTLGQHQQQRIRSLLES
ncbi:stationary phase inducible protein CsiE [Pantoea sp. 1.19]|uniref:stationary phase inducible protein CsiE n=1 Tax=Pantoea sp. 1.19 TaxID=1925589 RepID=UPI0009489E73|nr:stationary phase inducible protein CsiE [Pantoea sp. 1.19]